MIESLVLKEKPQQHLQKANSEAIFYAGSVGRWAKRVEPTSKGNTDLTCMVNLGMVNQ